MTLKEKALISVGLVGAIAGITVSVVLWRLGVPWWLL